MDATLIFALGGILGTALRVWVSGHHATFSRQSIADILIGGAVGLLYPIFPLVPLPEGATLVQQATLIGVIAYFSSDFLINLAAKLGVAPRPSAPTAQGPTQR